MYKKSYVAKLLVVMHEINNAVKVGKISTIFAFGDIFPRVSTEERVFPVRMEGLGI